MPVSILVADDSVTMRRIMELTFAGEDARVTTVASGELCIENAKNSRPDVVFADGSMPGLDGYGVASAVKSTPGLEKTAVILMASQKHPYDEAKGRAAGVDDHVLKPFDTQHVIDRVNQVLARPRTAAGAVAAPPPKAQGTVVGHMMPPGPPTPAVPPAAPRAAAPAAPAVVAAAPAAPAKPAATAPVAVAPAKAAPAVVAAAPAAPAKPAAPVPVAVAPAKEVRPAAAQTATAAMPAANGVELASKLAGLGLTSAQMEGVLALTREVIEQVVWEVVPELAETMIREEIRRLTAEG